MRPRRNLWDCGVREIGIQVADGGIELASRHKVSSFPNGGATMPRADFTGIRPSVEAKDIRCQGGRDVHGAAVHTDDAAGAADQPAEFRQSGLIEEILGVHRKRRKR